MKSSGSAFRAEARREETRRATYLDVHDAPLHKVAEVIVKSKTDPGSGEFARLATVWSRVEN